MTETTATPDAAAQPQPVTRQRQMVATGATLLTTVVLGVVTNYAVGIVAGLVYNKIIPPQPEPPSTDS